VEDSSFLFVPVNLSALVFNGLNIIFPATLVGTRMEESSILITLHCRPNLGSLLPGY
jgi:hypothetical protein